MKGWRLDPGFLAKNTFWHTFSAESWPNDCLGYYWRQDKSSNSAKLKLLMLVSHCLPSASGKSHVHIPWMKDLVCLFVCFYFIFKSRLTWSCLLQDGPYADPLNGLGHHHDHHRERRVPESHFISSERVETGIEFVKKTGGRYRHKWVVTMQHREDCCANVNKEWRERWCKKVFFAYGANESDEIWIL